MLNWFVKTAPIRAKFNALLVLQATLGSVGVVTTWLAGGDFAVIGAAAAAAAAIMVTMSIAASKICTPYVDTVLRMEALAAGDTDSAIMYTHHADCVGRMTKAMATFRDTALAQREAEGKQRQVVETLSQGLNELAEGHLGYRLNTPLAGEYESLRQSFNQTLSTLEDLMRRVAGSATSVSTGASEIRAASDDLALRNEQQAASLEETSAAMNQVTDAVRQTAGGAGEVQRAIAEAHREATEGGVVVSRATQAMAAIENSAQEISQIINVIDGIAFQTNLLALNAGVEAARAGDAGKGFAVVANEVRALAQRSAEAAKDIKVLITASGGQVANGVELVGETGKLLDKIVSSVGDVTTLVSSIADSASRQAVSLQEVNASVSEMDRMTQQNAAMVEQSTAAARSLAGEAEDLTRMVSRFSTSGQSSGHSAMSAIVAHDVPRLPSFNRSRSKSAPPVSHGNLALSSNAVSLDDWSEF